MVFYRTNKLVLNRLLVFISQVISFLAKSGVSLSIISYIDVNSLRYLSFDGALRVIVVEILL